MNKYVNSFRASVLMLCQLSKPNYLNTDLTQLTLYHVSTWTSEARYYLQFFTYYLLVGSNS